MSPNSEDQIQLVTISPQPVKRRAACDECRTKKLKCPGDQPACARCVSEDVACVYSVPKQMGRPKKRRRSGSSIKNGVLTTRSGDHLSRWNDEDASHGHVSLDAGVVNDTGMNDLYESWLAPSIDWQDGDDSTGSAATGLNLDDNFLHLPLEPQITSRKSPPQTLRNPPLADVVDSGLNLSSDLPDCACLSTMYISLSSLQQIARPFQFPFTLGPLREAVSAASSVLQCQECPQKFITCIQNTQLLGTLLVSIAERFGKLLDAITSEAERAEKTFETKKFSLTDLTNGTSQQHTGRPGCAAVFSLDFSPVEWRSMSKKVVRAEVYGPLLPAFSLSAAPEGPALEYSHLQHDTKIYPGNPTADRPSTSYLMGVIEDMYVRQRRWHAGLLPDDHPVDREGKLAGGRRPESEDQHLCLKLPAYAVELVRTLDWS